MNDDSLFSNSLEGETDLFQSTFKRPKIVLSAQERYNQRVEPVEKMRERLCYECGQFVPTPDYHKHTLEHEAVYLSYQLFYFERQEEENMNAVKSQFATNLQGASNSGVQKEEDSDEEDNSSIGSYKNNPCSASKLVMCTPVNPPVRTVPPLVVYLNTPRLPRTVYHCNTNIPCTSREGSTENNFPSKKILKQSQHKNSSKKISSRTVRQRMAIDKMDIPTRDAYHLVFNDFTEFTIEVCSITNDVRNLRSDLKTPLK